MLDINEKYFNLLLDRSNKKSQSMNLHCPEQQKSSNVIPYSIADESLMKDINVIDYQQLPNINTENLQNVHFSILKMQAGLGSSVERNDLIWEVEKRKDLGAKGTDLYFDFLGARRSIAELQLLQAIKLGDQKLYANV